MNDSVVVTGSTGFLARHTLPLLQNRAMACVRSRRSWLAQPWSSSLNVRVEEAPLAHLSDALPTLRSARAVLHLAGKVQHSRRDTKDLYATNVEGTLEAVRLAARLNARLVFASTSGTVGCFTDPANSADESAPFCEKVVRHWPYYHSKIVAEQRARNLAEDLGVELIIVRFPILLGPHDYRGRSTAHVRRFVEGRLPFVISGGIQIVDVRDVASAIVTLVDIEHPRPVYHLPGYSGPIVEFLAQCGAVVHRPVPPRIPGGVAWGLSSLEEAVARLLGAKPRLPAPVVVEMARHWWNICSLFAHEIGFISRPLEETLVDTIEWIESTAAP